MKPSDEISAVIDEPVGGLSTASPGLARKLAWTLGGMSAFGPFAVDMYLPAFPTMARQLGTTISMVQLTLAVFLLGLAFGQILWGTLSDHVGRRIPLLCGCLLSSSMAVVCATAHSIEVLIAARFFMGLGGCAGMVISRAIVRDLFEEKEAAKFYSMMMIVGGIGPILSPFLGTLLLTNFNWRAIFWTIALFGCLCVAAILWNIPETLDPGKRMRGHLVDVFRAYGRIIVNRRFLMPALTLGCTTGVLFTYLASASFIFMELFKVPVAHFGSLFATNAVGFYIGGQSNRVLLRRFTAEELLRKGIGLNITSGVLLVVCAQERIGGFAVVFVLLFLCMASLGLIFPNATAVAMQPFAAKAGTASALLGVLQFLLGSMGGALVGVFQNGSALPMAVQILCLGVIARGVLLLGQRTGRASAEPS